jgi:hypothetical protein
MSIKDILKNILDWFKEAEKPVAVQGIIAATAKALHKSVNQCQKIQPELQEVEVLNRILKEYNDER